MSDRSQRVSTGIPGLDQVLGGGLLPGALVFIVGAPGTGKTLMAQQISFHTAAAGRSALYFTALSEPHNKLLMHIRNFTFFDASVFGDRLQILNLEQLLKQGAEETANAVVQMAREQRAALVVIDGFRGLLSFVDDPVALRQLLYQLSAQLAVLGTTCIVALEAEPHDPALSAELTVADSIIALYHRGYRVTHRRLLEVVKARGSDPMPGFHSFVISTAGLVCYPQAELLPVKPAPGIPHERAAFGVAELDAMLDGGLTVGTSTILAGAPGAGKTTAALTWLLEGAAHGEPGLLMGFRESEQQLTGKAALVGLDLAGAMAAGSMALWTQTPVALDPNQLAAELRARLDGDGVRRLVIDSERELERCMEPERVDEYLTALIAYLRGERVTALFTREIPIGLQAELDFTDTPSAVLAENVLLLGRYAANGSLQRAVTVLKMRFSSFDPTPHEYELSNAGLALREAVDLEVVLPGTAGASGQASAGTV